MKLSKTFLPLIALTVALTPVASMAADEIATTETEMTVAAPVEAVEITSTEDAAPMVESDLAAAEEATVETAPAAQAEETLAAVEATVTDTAPAAAGDETAATIEALPAMPSEEIATATETPAAEEPREDQFASAVTNDELSTFRGGFGSTILNSSMLATLQGNQAVNTVSGENSIADGALNNVSGLTNIIQNSGNNVIIQSSFQVNVNINGQ